MRQTTRVEDEAYSLLGIFTISLSVVYGEGDKALGRLLAQLITSSGDTSILVWKGRSGGFNSCLPANIAAFRELATSHVPLAVAGVETDVISAALRASATKMSLVMELCDRLNDLPVPSFAGQRMKLPCFVFKLGPLSDVRHGTEHVFRAQTAVLGAVEIRTDEDISRFGSLYLVHPWMDFLLDRHPVGNTMQTMMEGDIGDVSSVVQSEPSFSEPSTKGPRIRTASLFTRLGRPFGGRLVASAGQDGELIQAPITAFTGATASLRAPSTISPTDRQIPALRMIHRLKQPFGALSLTPTRQNVEEYRRVAAGSLIIVQVKEISRKLMQNVRTLDVL